jgi:hypothetical protein
MQKLVSVIVIVITIICCFAMVACGKKGETTTSTSGNETTSGVTATSTNTTTAATTTQTSTAASSGSLWNDMPVYSNASQIQKGSWAIPPADDSDYSKFEWRYYETNASLSEVSDFYTEQMEAKGWEQQGWMETPQMNWGMFNKNNENDAAMVWITSEEGKTVVALWRATK